MATKIDIISGFLGAGKTTLIKKLLKEAYADEQVVLIENEFGEIGIDGGFLKEAGIQIREMNSGCICCSLVGDFGTSLKEVVDKYHPDRILIEPSGVGKLSDVIKAVQGVQGDVDIVLNSYTTVVDAKKCKMYMRNFGEFFDNQVEYAGAIIMSRTDIIDEKKAQQAMELLRGINAKAAIITTPIEKLDGKKILEVMEKPVSLEEELMSEEEVCPECGHVHEHGEHHHHDHDHDHECGCGHDHEEHEHHHDDKDHHDEDKDHHHDEDKEHHHDDKDSHDKEHHHDDKEHHHHDGEEGPEMDEHVWTSPANAIQIVKALTETISGLDKDNAQTYQKNAEAYIAKLEKLDKDFHDVIDHAKRKEIIVGDRFPFLYFAKEFGLTYYAAFPGCSTDTEANPATIAFLVDKVKEDHIPVVFHIEMSNEQMSKAIAEATGAKNELLNAVHNVSDEEFKKGVTYIDLMNHNVKVLKEALN